MTSYYIEDSAGVAVTVFPCDFGNYNSNDIKEYDSDDFVSTDIDSVNDETLQYSFEDMCMCPSFDCEFFYLFGDDSTVEAFIESFDKRLYRKIIREEIFKVGEVLKFTTSKSNHSEIVRVLESSGFTQC